MIQLTGKYNFDAFQKHAFTNEWIKNGEDFVSNPELVTQSGKYALLSAAYFWVSNSLYKIADKSLGNEKDVKFVNEITIVINKDDSEANKEKRRKNYLNLMKSEVFNEFE